MRRILVLLSIGLLATATLSDAAPTRAACQEDQRAGTSGDLATQLTAPGRAHGGGACEGEHWDGEDTSGANEGGFYLWYLDPNDRIDRVGFSYGSSAGGTKPDPAANGPFDAVHLRVVGQGSPGWKEGDYNVGDGTLYARADSFGVGALALSASGHQDLVPCLARDETPCSADPGPGPDGALLGSAEVALYFEDHTDQVGGDNAVAGAVQAATLTQNGDVGEESPGCSQADYQAGLCTRDNFAVTVELLA